MLSPSLILQLQNQLALMSVATREYLTSRNSVTDEIDEDIQTEEVEAAQGLVERTEQWREAPVVRDESGKFASKASSPGATETPAPTEEEPSPKTVPIDKILQEKATTFSAGLKKFEREQVEMVNEAVLKGATGRIKELMEQRKGLAADLVDMMFGKYAKQARKQLAELCKPINPKLAEGIEEDPYKEVAADLKRLKRQANTKDATALAKDIAKSFQYSVAKYNKTIDDLQNATGDNAELMHAAGKAIALTVPVTTFLAAGFGAAAVGGVLAHAIAAAPIFAAGGAAAGAAKLATGVLVSTAAWKVKSKSIEEGLDILEVDNKLTRRLLKWSAFLAGDLSMLPGAPVANPLEIPKYLFEPGTAPDVLTNISSFLGETSKNAFMGVINVTGEDLMNFAVFPALNSLFGDALAPGRNLSGKSYSQMRELKRSRAKAEKTLKAIKEKAEKYNEQFEEAMLALKELPDMEVAA